MGGWLASIALGNARVFGTAGAIMSAAASC